MEIEGAILDLRKIWWPGTELNRRRQPFQAKHFHNHQQLTSARETAKYL